MNKIIQGDCLEVIKTLKDNSIDAVVTDPPYGLSFMSKKWDYDVPSVKVWQECLRVLKPGGHLLAFAGTRTQHRMAVRIEDAGFDIRDMIAWVYGSGFPKSLNIGKAVDKIQGNEREVVGKKIDISTGRPMSAKQAKAGNGKNINEGWDRPWRSDDKHCEDMTLLTKGTSEWEGWGTALKPSHEDITVARKPIETSTDKEYNLGICQKLFASIAKHNSMLNQPDLKGGQSIAQWIAEKNINTSEDLREAMVILQSYITANTNLNIVWSWLNILVENLIATNTSTISTKLNTTTELKILNSMEWENILANIIQAKDNKTNGLSADVYNAESLFNALKLKLNYILEHSADDNAIFLEKIEDLRPSLEPITVARKPIEGTVAENVLKWGVGGINIDGCRVEGKKPDCKNIPRASWRRMEGRTDIPESTPQVYNSTQGRFPANLIHDNSEEVVELFPNDSQRFFYCAKASKSERNMGCEGLEEKAVAWSNQAKAELARGNTDFTDEGRKHNKVDMLKNNHPTVKPIALMEYLIKLVSREGQLILDPFAGSGSTLIACKNLKRNYLGIEKEQEYIKIAEDRLKAVPERLF